MREKQNLAELLIRYRNGEISQEEIIKLLEIKKSIHPKDLSPDELITEILNLSSVLLGNKVPSTEKYLGTPTSELFKRFGQLCSCVPLKNRGGAVDNFLNFLSQEEFEEKMVEE